MFKKILAAACALAMLVGTTAVLPEGAFDLGAEIQTNAANELTEGDYKYKKLSASRVEVTGYTGTETAVNIPSKLGGIYVGSIGDGAFYQNQTIVSVSIPDRVESIGREAFFNCDSLETVKFPTDLDTIGSEAFYSCEKLDNITLPDDQLYEIGSEAFCRCTSLSSVKIPDTVQVIGYGAFAGCTSLDTATLSRRLNAVPNDCFSGCEILEKIEIPDSVNSIGNRAFKNCEALESVYISQSANSIGEYAFYGCSSLTSVFIPDSVQEITGWYTFAECSRLKSVHLSENLKYIPTYCFENCSRLTEINIPRALQMIGQSTFRNCIRLTSITIPDTVEYIYDNAFWGCPLDEVTIPYQVIRIDSGAFGFGTDGNGSRKKMGTKFKVYRNSAGYDYCWKNELPFTILTNPYEEAFDAAIIGKDSSSYSNTLATDLAKICEASGTGDDDDIVKAYRDLGFYDCAYEYKYPNYFYSDDCTVGAKFYDSDTVILLVTPDSKDESEDFLKNYSGLSTKRELFGNQEVYDYAYSGQDYYYQAISSFYEKYPQYVNKKTKVIITGHGSAGAGANLLAARLTDSAAGGVVSKSDIFCYTFGALDSIRSDHALTQYTNIHNIYNFFDSYGPFSVKGGLLLKTYNTVGTIVGKYGHIDLFVSNSAIWYFFSQFSSLTGNHMISAYISALEEGVVSCSQRYKFAFVKCPVDVEIVADGKVVGKTVNNVIDESVTTIPMYIYDEEKYFLLPEDQKYTINITAYDEGEMEFFIEDYDEEAGEYSVKSCEKVQLEPDKKFRYTQSTDELAEEPELYVLGDDDKPVMQVGDQGEETPAEVKDTVPGDADGDGVCNMQDYALVQRYLAGWEVEIDIEACDLNGDGDVNMQDYALFQRKLAGW